MKTIQLPLNVIMYRGTDMSVEKNFKKYIANWYTFNIIYACMYVKKETGAIKIFEVIKPISLINIISIKLKDLSDKKDIEIGNIKVSLKFLFSVLFGYGIKKNDNDFFRGEIDDIKNEGTQIYEFYKLIKEVDREEKTLKWFEKLKLNIPKEADNKILSFNRISDGLLDKIFLNALKKFKNIDGYYAPKINSNWSIVDCKNSVKTEIELNNKCKYLQYEEIAIFNTDKLKTVKTIQNNIINICNDIKL